MNLKIIKADYKKTQHGDDLIFLLNAYAQDPMGGGQPLDQAVQDNLIEQLNTRSFFHSFLAYINDKPAGLINCLEGFSTFKCKPLLNIHDVVVLPKYRGQGISQAMLKTVEVFAKEKGCIKLTLEVLEGNFPAQDSYLKYGFSGYELDPKMGKALFWEKAIC